MTYYRDSTGYALDVAKPLNGLIAAAIWYTPYRLSRLLGLRRSRPLCTVVAVFVILAVAGMMSLNASPNALVGGAVTMAGLLFFHLPYLSPASSGPPEALGRITGSHDCMAGP